MRKKISLTGVKPTGHPHVGNYFGAILPALELSKEYDARYFIADYHALNVMKNKDELKTLTYEVAATWLACGLNTDAVLFYKQSDIPEIFELVIILAAFTPKGLMNRALAYKAKVAQNTESDKDNDVDINMGLYTYPILMAADILLFDSDVVPIGKDQVQHVEMTIDIAESVNKNYNYKIFKIPDAVLSEDTKYIIGLDGRKMSKSYNNSIELFLNESELKKKIKKIVTNSQSIEEKKDPDKCTVFSLYKLFTNKEQQGILSKKYSTGGMSWGYTKNELFNVMNEYLKPLREKYEYYINNKRVIDKYLKEGAEKARKITKEKIKFIREKIGIINY